MNVLNEMKVLKVEDDQKRIVVQTTGAEFVIEKDQGAIACAGLVNGRRNLAVIKFGCSLADLRVVESDEDSCVMHMGIHEGITGYGGTHYFLRIQIYRDSLVRINSQKEVGLTVEGCFQPEYTAEKNGNVLLIGKDSGIGLYPYKELHNVNLADLSSKNWKADYTFDKYYTMLISVFPPRKFNEEQSIAERIVHHGTLSSIENVNPPPGPYPSDAMLKDFSKFATVLVLHEGIWRGYITEKGLSLQNAADTWLDASFCTGSFIPADENEFRRVIAKAHDLGMKIIPYTSPFYSTALGKDFLGRAGKMLAKYDLDGIYFDDISYNDILYAYDMIRETRAMLKDKIIYYHCTLGALYSRSIYCPFVDTYADYILRAESGGGFDDRYIRYVISGYNISNSIGYVCHHGYKPEFIEQIIDKALAARVRFYLGSPATAREEVLRRHYFPKLMKNQ